MSTITIKKEPGANVSYQKDGGTKQVFHAGAFAFSARGVDVKLSCNGVDLSFKSTDTISINGAPFTGSSEKIVDFLNNEVFAGSVALPPTPTSSNTGSSGGISPDQTFASNAEAVAAIGVGKAYKSTTLINGSPIILITV